MSYLEKLKTVPLPEKKAVSPEQHRRTKFIEKLDRPEVSIIDQNRTVATKTPLAPELSG